MFPLGNIIRGHNVHFPCYADDTQLHISISPNDQSNIATLHKCFAEIKHWMANNFLQLDLSKSNVIVFDPTSKMEDITTNIGELAPYTKF